MQLLIFLSVLGGLLAIDFRGSLRIMLYQPVCSGLLAGLMLGEPSKGILAGTLLQIIFLGNIYLRGERDLDIPSAGVISAAVFILVDLRMAGDLSVSGMVMAASLLIGILGGLLGYYLYRFIRSRLSRAVEKALERSREGDYRRASFLHLSMLGFHFLAGFVICLILIPAGYLLAAEAVSAHAGFIGPLEILYIFIPFIGIGSLLRIVLFKYQAFWFLSGLIIAGAVLAFI
ncbi:MAG: PTS sugar transporter subunit IIC [Candidatus Krumholzibacteriales bacterium]